MRILVHLHIYYEAQLTGFLKRLHRIQSHVPLHLAVTVTENHPKMDEIFRRVKAFFPDADLYAMPNVGYDIYPFISVLQKVKLEEYDYVLKLHTKGTRDRRRTYLNDCALTDSEWSKRLVYALIGSPKRFQRALQTLESHKRLGLLGADSCVIEEKAYLDAIEKELERMGLPAISSLRFVAGTMFLARAKLLAPLCLYEAAAFQRSDSIIKDGTFAHICERLFGGVVLAQGYELAGLPDARVPAARKLAKAVMASGEFCMRLLRKLVLRVKKKGVNPLIHYLLKGQKENRKTS